MYYENTCENIMKEISWFFFEMQVKIALAI